MKFAKALGHYAAMTATAAVSHHLHPVPDTTEPDSVFDGVTKQHSQRPDAKSYVNMHSPKNTQPHFNTVRPTTVKNLNKTPCPRISLPSISFHVHPPTTFQYEPSSRATYNTLCSRNSAQGSIYCSIQPWGIAGVRSLSKQNLYCMLL